MKKIIFYILTIIWIVISSYLTYLHFSELTISCNVWNTFSYIQNDKNWISCNSVLQSKYSVMLGIPTAIFWITFYVISIIIFFLLNLKKNFIFNKILFIFTLIWLFFSIYFSYLQIFVINSFCIYCSTSAVITFILFMISIYFVKNKQW